MSDDKDFEVRILPPGQRIDVSHLRQYLSADIGSSACRCIMPPEETELADALALKVASEAEMCANYYVPKG